MPGIFHEVDTQWRLALVAASPSLLRLDPPGIEPYGVPRLHCAAQACLLVRVVERNKWAVLVPGGIALRHNGVPVSAGLRMLEHRDALALEGRGILFFTTEEPAHIETFAAAAPVTCPRCRSEVREGETVVQCPSCGVVHHEREDRTCWTYAETCALCAHPTALDAELRWTPEEL